MPDVGCALGVTQFPAKPRAGSSREPDDARASLTCTRYAYMLRAMVMTIRGKTTMTMAMGKRAVSGLVLPMV